MAKARDIMSKTVLYVDRDATVADAVLLMNEHDVSGLVVNRRSPGDTFGIVSMRDICYKVVAKGRDVNEVVVHEVMTKPVIVLLPDLSVKHVARLFANNGITRAPVIDDNEIIGLVSIQDVMVDLHLVNAMT